MQIPAFGLSALYAAFFLLFGGSRIWAEIPVPPFSGYVVDQAGMLNPAEREALASTLRRFEESGLGQMAVLIVPSLEGEPIERFGMRVAEKWKPGSKQNDNGLILLIARDDRALRIEVGYGLEGTINDAKAGDIIRQILVPALREGKPAEGIRHAIDAIAKLIQPDGTWESDPDTPSVRYGADAEELPPHVRLLAIVVFFALFVLISILTRGRGWIIFGGPFRGAGGSGSFGGGFRGGGGGRFSGGGASGRW